MASVAGFFLAMALHETEHLTYRDGVGPAGEQIATFCASARFHKATLFEAGEDQFQKFLGDVLPFGDVGNADGVACCVQRQVKNGLQSVLTFY